MQTVTWELPDLGLQIRDFEMDPVQDLLTLIEYPAAHETWVLSFSLLTPLISFEGCLGICL